MTANQRRQHLDLRFSLSVFVELAVRLLGCLLHDAALFWGYRNKPSLAPVGLVFAYAVAARETG